MTLIHEKAARVAVIGLGYVGLPAALKAAEAGYTVTGIDSSNEHVNRLRRGSVTIDGVSSDDLLRQTADGRFSATSDFSSLPQADVIMICVPTPLREDLPDISHVEAATGEIASRLRPQQLVILESTTYPGTTDELLFGILEKSGWKAGVDFYLGFSPERIDPGNRSYVLSDLPKIIGGINAESTRLMEAFYGTFFDKVVPVSSPRTAEMVKLLENTYRHVNIALANEMAILCHDLGVDVWEVIEAAATKPFGFEAFYPGPGWGGHCIPVDPAYLSWRVRQMGATARFVELAREFNQKMPAYVVQRIGEALNERGRSLKDAALLILGVTYKANVGDVRESPAVEIIQRARKAGGKVAFHDPYVPALTLRDGEMQRSELDTGALEAADLVLIHTAHSSYDWAWVAEHAPLVLDTRNAMQGLSGRIVKL